MSGDRALEFRIPNDSEYEIEIGCLIDSGAYVASADDLRFSSIMRDGDACPDLDARFADAEKMAGISGTTGYRIVEDLLELLTRQGSRLVFERLDG